jgi:hypothetical protein
MKPAYTLLLLILFAACKKEKLDQGEQLVSVNFQNTSMELISMLQGTPASQRVTILLDTPVVYTPDENLQDKGVQLPYFNSGYSDANSYNLFFYPNVRYNTTEPWMTYMRIPAGMHTTGVADTANRQLTYGKINLQSEKHYSIFVTDSAGIFDMIPAEDDRQMVQGKIRIRLAHMSPSSDTVCLSAGKDSVLAFQQGVRFKEVTPFQDFPLDSNQLFTLRVYQKSDPSVILSRTFINAMPGRSYTLIFRGYTRPVTYKNKFQVDQHFERNAESFIERMY